MSGPPDALEPVGAAWVSGDYFDTLGLDALRGPAVDVRPTINPAPRPLR